jgi:hypothetical protein
MLTTPSLLTLNRLVAFFCRSRSRPANVLALLTPRPVPAVLHAGAGCAPDLLDVYSGLGGGGGASRKPLSTEQASRGAGCVGNAIDESPGERSVPCDSWRCKRDRLQITDA